MAEKKRAILVNPARNPMRRWSESEWDAACEDFLVPFMEGQARLGEQYGELYELLEPLQSPLLKPPQDIEFGFSDGPPELLDAVTRYFHRRRPPLAPAPTLRIRGRHDEPSGSGVGQ